MDNNQNVLEVKSNSKISKKLLLILGALLFMASIAGNVLLQNKVSSQNNEISALKKMQLPQKKFTNYEDCINNGGVILNTINAQLSGCLGGDEDELGDLPQHQAFLQYSAQDLPRIDQRKKSEIENRVDGAENGPEDLVAFLKHDYSGCEIGSPDENGQGYYKILKLVPERFALLNYGCADDPGAISGNYKIIAMKLGDGWSLLSPTNNFNENGVPSCLLVDMFKISKDLVGQCYENTGYNNGKLKNVKHP